MIYFIQENATNLIKIGYTSGAAEDRARAMKTGNPATLTVLLQMPGDTEHERSLHAKFAADRVAGEWFKPSPAILAHIIKIAAQKDAFHYRGIFFGSPLEARWAAFFELASWQWQFEPVEIGAWIPTFRVQFHCGHSECAGYHTLLIEVQPFESIAEFKGHPSLNYNYGQHCETGRQIDADASAAFGVDPSVTWWEMAHGSGGGEENVFNWIERGGSNGEATAWRLWDLAKKEIR